MDRSCIAGWGAVPVRARIACVSCPTTGEVVKTARVVGGRFQQLSRLRAFNRSVAVGAANILAHSRWLVCESKLVHASS
eukprot:6091241-Pyramimonas_sp.AAC.2